jgi:hypothetical protein
MAKKKASRQIDRRASEPARTRDPLGPLRGPSPADAIFEEEFGEQARLLDIDAHRSKLRHNLSALRSSLVGDVSLGGFGDIGRRSFLKLADAGLSKVIWEPRDQPSNGVERARSALRMAIDLETIPGIDLAIAYLDSPTRILRAFGTGNDGRALLEPEEPVPGTIEANVLDAIRSSDSSISALDLASKTGHELRSVQEAVNRLRKKRHDIHGTKGPGGGYSLRASGDSSSSTSRTTE